MGKGGQPSNRQKVVRFLREHAMKNKLEVTAKDVSKGCKLCSPVVASCLMREIFDGVDGVKLTVDKSKNRRYIGTVYHIILVTT